MVGFIETATNSREQNRGRRLRTDQRLSKGRDRWSRPTSTCRRPAITRTGSRDPLVHIKSANTYQFVGSDPVGMVDASGDAWYQSGWWWLIPPVGLGFTIGNAVASYEEAGYDAASAQAAQRDWMQRAANPNSKVPRRTSARERGRRTSRPRRRHVELHSCRAQRSEGRFPCLTSSPQRMPQRRWFTG